ncbi:MAG: TatD family hydrolase [Spirochaetota bacterium]|nr:MAG: TatD family hydrolase [Spirochaetota bacterium]
MLFDTHCHLILLNSDKIDINAIAMNAVEKKVSLLIDISVGTHDFLKRGALAHELTNRFPLSVYMTAGIPPYYADKRKPADIDDVRAQCRGEQRVIGIGEIGLDYYHLYGSKVKQKTLFIQQIELANDLDLPVVIHTRDSDNDLIDIVKEHIPAKGGIIHCFSSGMESAKRLLDLGFVLSFAGNITYKKSYEIRDVARMVPEDMFVIETDAPYLSPEGKRGKPNEPANVALIARFISDLRGESLEMVASNTADTARRVFGIQDD